MVLLLEPHSTTFFRCRVLYLRFVHHWCLLPGVRRFGSISTKFFPTKFFPVPLYSGAQRPNISVSRARQAVSLANAGGAQLFRQDNRLFFCERDDNRCPTDQATHNPWKGIERRVKDNRFHAMRHVLASRAECTKGCLDLCCNPAPLHLAASPYFVYGVSRPRQIPICARTMGHFLPIPGVAHIKDGNYGRMLLFGGTYASAAVSQIDSQIDSSKSFGDALSFCDIARNAVLCPFQLL